MVSWTLNTDMDMDIFKNQPRSTTVICLLPLFASAWTP